MGRTMGMVTLRNMVSRRGPVDRRRLEQVARHQRESRVHGEGHEGTAPQTMLAVMMV